jgi:predicted nucleic acid-binding protein
VKTLLDSDILLDVALQRARFFLDSSRMLEWAETAPGQAAVAWHSLSKLAYLLRPDARSFIRGLLEFVEVAPVATLQARQAVNLPLPDFEDALQVASALSFGANYIVTRNRAHYRRSPVPALSPTQFLARLKGTVP